MSASTYSMWVCVSVRFIANCSQQSTYQLSTEHHLCIASGERKGRDDEENKEMRKWLSNTCELPICAVHVCLTSNERLLLLRHFSSFSDLPHSCLSCWMSCQAALLHHSKSLSRLSRKCCPDFLFGAGLPGGNSFYTTEFKKSEE